MYLPWQQSLYTERHGEWYRARRRVHRRSAAIIPGGSPRLAPLPASSEEAAGGSLYRLYWHERYSRNEENFSRSDNIAWRIPATADLSAYRHSKLGRTDGQARHTV